MGKEGISILKKLLSHDECLEEIDKYYPGESILSKKRKAIDYANESQAKKARREKDLLTEQKLQCVKSQWHEQLEQAKAKQFLRTQKKWQMPLKQQSISKLIKLQSLWKGRQVRQKYSFNHLDNDELANCRTFLIGNDPIIKGLEKHSQSINKIALIGTSGFRALKLICELSNDGPIPKLIIVDNSFQVINFWRNFRDFITSSQLDDVELFFKCLNDFLDTQDEFVRDLSDDIMTKKNYADVEYENQAPVKLICQLANMHGLEYLFEIIKHATFIGQSWTDEKLFISLKNILQLNKIEKIVVYPSNISSCISYNDKIKLFKNIETLSPVLTIMTDCCPSHLRPENFYLSTAKSAPAIQADGGSQHKSPLCFKAN